MPAEHHMFELMMQGMSIEDILNEPQLPTDDGNDIELF